MTISFVKNIPVKFDQVDEDFIVDCGRSGDADNTCTGPRIWLARKPGGWKVSSIRMMATPAT